jgi:hypothetical protein
VRQPPNGYLNQGEIWYNRRLAHHRVSIENFFGRQCAKFHILIKRWTFGEPLCPGVFRICSALVNFDMLRPGAV